MATELEELVVRLEAQNSQFIQQMSAAQIATAKAMDKMATSVSEFTKTEKDVDGWGKTMQIMAGNILANLAVKAFELTADAAKQLFDVMLVQGIEASNQEIEAINRLNQALGANGNFIEDATERFGEWAKTLERTTKFQSDAVLSGAALLESMTGLSEQGLKGATEAAMKLSNGLGIDLDTAIRLVGKAANGQTDAFSRYGISIAKTDNDATNFKNTLETINSRFPNLTAGMNSFAGAQGLISKGFEDIQKVIGGAITKNYAVVEAMAALGKELFGVADGLEDSEQAMREMIANGLIKAIEYTGYFVAAMDAMSRAVTAIWRGVAGFVVDSALELGKALNYVGVVSDETVADLQRMSDGIGSAIGALTEETGLSKFQESLAAVGFAAEQGLEKVKAGLEAIPEPAASADDAMKRFTEAQKQRAEEGKKLSEELIAAQWEDNAIRDEILSQRLASEEQKIIDANATGLINETQKNEALKALKDKYADEDRKRALAKQKFQADTDMAQLNAAGAVANALYTIGKSSSKELFLVTRAAAVAQAVVQANLASAQALASPPGPPFTIPLASAIKIAGYANAATMAATAIQGLRGGMTEVPGIGSGDSYGPVALAPGERVVDSNANADLKKAIQMILSGGAGGSERVVVELSLKDQAIEYIEAKLIERQRLSFASA